MGDVQELTTYLVLSKTDRPYWERVRVVRTTKKKPALKRDEIAIKLRLVIPMAAFEEAMIQASINVPDDSFLLPEVEGEVLTDEE